MPRRPHEANGDARDRVARRGGDEIRSSGAEADDDDSARGHGPAAGGTSEPEDGGGDGDEDDDELLAVAGGLIEPVDGSNVPNLGSTVTFASVNACCSQAPSPTDWSRAASRPASVDTSANAAGLRSLTLMMTKPP